MLLGLLWGGVWAQVFFLKGEVRTASGEPLSHVIVRLPQTGFQTVSGVDGRFVISVAMDTLVIELRHLGYRLHRDTIYRAEGKDSYVFTLYPQEVRLGGVVITEGGKDPGELIVRRAIAAKSSNRVCLSSFRVETYTMFSARLSEPPGTLLQKLAENSLAPGQVFFMSETFSYIYFSPPDQYREEIVRSRIVGTQRYSFLGGWLFQGFDPYAERLSLPELTETPFILPLAQDAPLFYRYRLLGSYWEEERFFYKIAVEPRAGTSPCVAGYVIIADESYALVGLEWHVTTPRPVRYVDSLGVRVTYVPIRGCYQIGELSFKGQFRVSLPVVGSIAILGEGYASYRKYQFLQINQAPLKSRRLASPSLRSKSPTPTPNLYGSIPDSLSEGGQVSSFVSQPKSSDLVDTFQVRKIDFGEFVRILPEATQASTAFWDSLRQAPLDSAQLRYLQRHDTMVAERERSPTQRRRGSWGLIRDGVGWSYSMASESRRISTEIKVMWPSYTPLEGWVVPLRVILTHSERPYSTEVTLLGRYGFGWRRFLPVLRIQRESRQYPLWRWSISSGIGIREPTDFVQIPLLWNAIYKIAGREVLWQGYPRPFVEVGARRYIHRTLETEGRLSWDRRAYKPDSSSFYEGWRAALWIEWSPGTRLFNTPRSTLLIPPERVLTWRVRFGGEAAWLPDGWLFSFSTALLPTLSISPLGRLQAQVGGSWQNRTAPWADALYISTSPLIFHRSYSDFMVWAPYRTIGRWGGYFFLAWLPEGGLLRLMPLLRRTSWQEALALRALYAERSSGWHIEGSFVLHQLNLRLRKTGLARPFSVGIHADLLGVVRGVRLTVGVGDILSPLGLSKPARS
ncbi:MAG: DUF5686 and carboxypeptidase regulatory-like domain-containing protein [Bacteroidia bacterium]|nr:DUF5686 and carboxypeptidase regulatory-like domain-containing protein [Bacteroidia bacterium]